MYSVVQWLKPGKDEIIYQKHEVTNVTSPQYVKNQVSFYCLDFQNNIMKNAKVWVPCRVKNFVLPHFKHSTILILVLSIGTHTH